MQARTGLQNFSTRTFRQAVPLTRTLGLTPANRRAPAARKPYYRPTYRPPMIASTTPKQLGGFWDTMSLTVGLGAGGLGALMLSGVLPKPFKTIFQVGGIGLLAISAINLMSGEAEASDTTESVETSYPIGDEADFQQITAKILEPSRGAEVPRGLFSSDYDVKVSWANNSEKEIAVPFQVHVEEYPQMGLFTEDYRGIAYSGVVTLKPKEVQIVDMEIPLKYRGAIAAMAVAVNLSLRKVSAAGQAFEVAQTTFAVY